MFLLFSFHSIACPLPQVAPVPASIGRCSVTTQATAAQQLETVQRIPPKFYGISQQCTMLNLPLQSQTVTFSQVMMVAKFIALTPPTGQLLWYYSTGGEVISSPAIVNGAVYVGSRDGSVYALNAH